MSMDSSPATAVDSSGVDSVVRTQQIIDLERKPIGRLFFQLSTPLVFGMLVQGLYNIVDAIFVSRGVGPLAVGGVSVVFPIQIFIFSMAVLVGHGAASIVTRLLGAGKYDEANSVAGNSLLLGIIIAIFLTASISLFMLPILSGLSISDALLPYAIEYLQPLIYGVIFVFLSSNLTDLLRSEGKMKYLMLITITSSVLNVILDAVFIFGLDMGVSGAALATVAAQVMSALMAFVFIVRGNTQLKVKWKNLRVKLATSIDMMTLGSPVFLGHLGFSCTLAVANYSLANANLPDADIQISAYGIIGRTFIFMMLPLIGFVTSFKTIVGYNYGAARFDRVKASIKFGLIVSTIFTLSMTVVMLFFPEVVVSLFSDDAELIAASVSISKVMFLGWPTISVFMVCSSYFQAVGKVGPAFMLPLLRVYLLLIPGLVLVPLYIGVEYIWFAYPVADLVCFLVILLMLGSIRKKKRQSRFNADNEEGVMLTPDAS